MITLVGTRWITYLIDATFFRECRYPLRYLLSEIKSTLAPSDPKSSSRMRRFAVYPQRRETKNRQQSKTNPTAITDLFFRMFDIAQPCKIDRRSIQLFLSF